LISIAGCSSDAKPSVEQPSQDAALLDREPSSGCGVAAGYSPGTSADVLPSGRSFRVHVPPGSDGMEALPLVLMLHGGGGSGLQFEERSADMDPIADRERFITVYPDGSGALQSWNGGGCCGYAVREQIDDVAFIGQLLDTLERKLCVDRRRVFATGMSNGAILTHRLGCELAARIAAIAPVAGTDMTMSCTPARAIPIMHTHGTADGHVPFEGGTGCGPQGDVAFTSVPQTLERWRVRNGCSGETAPSFMQGDGSCNTYVGCRADTTLCAIAGGGHSWPGGQPAADLTPCPGNGPQSTTYFASEAIWRFFVAHPR
jgi:polyhydroxybutyrate depolymerase